MGSLIAPMLTIPASIGSPEASAKLVDALMLELDGSWAGHPFANEVPSHLCFSSFDRLAPILPV
jgi:hypothetical protein